jgi:hypothetical protein
MAAVALVGSYELLMVIICGTQSAADVPPKREEEPSAGAPDTLQVQAVEEFADDVTAGRMLSIRAIRARLHVGSHAPNLATLSDG